MNRIATHEKVCELLQAQIADTMKEMKQAQADANARHKDDMTNLTKSIEKVSGKLDTTTGKATLMLFGVLFTSIGTLVGMVFVLMTHQSPG